MKRFLLTFLFLLTVFFASAQMQQDRQLADQYFNNAEYEKAEPIYDKLMDQDPFGTYQQYFRCLIALKDFDKAEKLVRKISRKQPENLSYNVDLGYVYELRGTPDKAKQQYEKAIKALKPDQGMIATLANAFLVRQLADYAVQTYSEGRKLMRGTYPFYFEMAEAYFQKGDIGKMIDEYLDAVGDNPMTQQSVLNVLQSRLGSDPDNAKGEYLRTSLL